ncbi:c-type cytochrome [Aquimarina brevivitae]|uniref:Quinol:cytochrome c oxidoreductase monoheme cytochrome subunit n=1 Tax=Aquimarina brevivitae TaxID=323412 RepID=A0A4Q7PIY6_9FLAO|nr:cytochrome c [Aquimarina brevivitae]RZS98872.1 quinol:cytochrome c oxidoreductase monoheme cytochrome subunit [Aquimarina brevivitae]
MKNTLKIVTVTMMVFTLLSCQDKRKPNYQYMPNMYESVGYETYGEYNVFENDQEAKLPVEGSVPRGWMPYDFENSNKGYQTAKDSLKNPIAYTEENLAEGKALYDIYCAVCHGAKGDGQGILVQREKILGVPAYNDAGRAITEGSIYHVMYYGINSMGSYASQTSIEERWQIVAYVEKLKAELDGKAPRVDKLDESDAPSDMIPAVNADPEVAVAEEAEETTNE